MKDPDITFDHNALSVKESIGLLENDDEIISQKEKIFKHLAGEFVGATVKSQFVEAVYKVFFVDGIQIKVKLLLLSAILEFAIKSIVSETNNTVH